MDTKVHSFCSTGFLINNTSLNLIAFETIRKQAQEPSAPKEAKLLSMVSKDFFYNLLTKAPSDGMGKEILEIFEAYNQKYKVTKLESKLIEKYRILQLPNFQGKFSVFKETDQLKEYEIPVVVEGGMIYFCPLINQKEPISSVYPSTGDIIYELEMTFMAAFPECYPFEYSIGILEGAYRV